LTTNSAYVQRTSYDDEQETSDRDCKEDHFQREKGDAETAIDGVSSQRERPGAPVVEEGVRAQTGKLKDRQLTLGLDLGRSVAIHTQAFLGELVALVDGEDCRISALLPYSIAYRS